MGDVTISPFGNDPGLPGGPSAGGETYGSERPPGQRPQHRTVSCALVETSAKFHPSPAVGDLLDHGGGALSGPSICRASPRHGDHGCLPGGSRHAAQAIRQLSEVSGTIQKGLAGAESISRAARRDSQRPIAGPSKPNRLSGRIDIRNLAFRYPGADRDVLRDIRLRRRGPAKIGGPGGRSGSGKSTLASLIPRFYHHSEGRIPIDGIDVEEFRLGNLRRHIALVAQRVTLFS